MFIVGTNSYVSVDEADAYITANYEATNEARVKWEGLSDTVKEKYLNRATLQIDNLIIVGRKVDITQTLEFPRAIPTKYSTTNDPLKGSFVSGYFVQSEVPEEVKSSEIEQAVTLSLYDGENLSKRQKLANDGVSQFSLGSLSETIARSSRRKLRSDYAMEMMRPYLLGGVSI